MNDKIFYNLESEISKNYKAMWYKRKENELLESLQTKILKNIALMLEVIKNEQDLMNSQYEKIIRDPALEVPSEFKDIDKESKSKYFLIYKKIDF